MNENINATEREENGSAPLPVSYENPPYEDKTTLPDNADSESIKEEAKSTKEDSDDAFKNILTKNGKPKNKFVAILSFIFGIASVVLGFFTPWGITVALLSVGFSLLSRNSLGYFHPLSIAGLSLGTVGVVIPIALKLLAPLITALYS